VLQNHEVNLQLNANRGIFLEEGDGVFYTGWDGDLTVNGPLSGPGRLVKADNGRLLLGAAGDHTGDTVLRHHSSGPRAIVLLHGDALQQSTFDATTIGGTSGTLDLNNLDVVLGGLKGAGASITNFTGQLSIGNNHQDTVFSGSLGGSGSLVKIGDGSLTLAGDNPYTGGTSICDGVLQIGAGGTTGSLGSGNVTNDGVLVFNRSNNITVANAITGTGSVRKEGQNELILSGSNDYSGGTTVTGGLLRATDNTIGTGGLTLQDGGVFFNVASEAGGVDPDNDFQNAVTLAAGGGGFRAGWGAMTLSGQIDGVGSLTIVNDGRITLTNTANAYEGDTIIGAAGSGTSATLRLGASEVIPHGPGKGNVVFNPIAGDTATLELNGHTETVNALVSSAEGTSRVTGPGTLIVGANDASGAFAGILTGAMSLVKIGNGTQVLSGDSNNYTGATTIDGGTLQLHGGDNRLPVGTSVAFADAAGATLDLNGTNQTVRWLTGGGPSGGHVVNTGGATSTLTLNLGNPGNRTFDGTIDGDIRVVVANSTTKNTDVQIFTRTNSYTSGTVVDNGHLRVREDSYLGTVPASLDPQNIVLRKGGVLQNHEVNLQLNANRGIFLEEGDGVFYTGWDRDLTVNGPLFGPGRLVKADNGRLLLAAAGSHTGDTVFQYYATGPRAIVLLHENALQQSTFDATVLGGAGDFVLDLNHLNVVLGGLKGGGASITNFTGQLSVGNNHQDTVFSGSLSGSGSLVKIGEGMLTLAGANLYTGATRIDIGTLRVDGSLTGTSGVTVESAAVLGGRGRIHAAVGGAGLVAPGASPGILTVGQVDPSGGLDFAFEFTGTGNPLWSEPAASVNDVLRMTDLQTPFTAPLTAENVVSVYFDVADVAAGDTFRGGFFTDASDDFLGSLEDAAYHYFVYGDGQGTAATYNDKSYYSLADWDSWVWVELSTPMVALANFAGGDVLHGRVSQFAVVPEPGTFLMAGAGLAILLGWRRRRQ
jgi:autotransporter-associated beta strand protein